MKVRLAICATLIPLFAGACSHSGEAADRRKMEMVVAEVQRETADPAVKEAFSHGQVFSKLNKADLPVNLIGVSVPLRSGHRAFVSFELSYFHDHSIPELAKNAIEDYARARNTK